MSLLGGLSIFDEVSDVFQDIGRGTESFVEDNWMYIAAVGVTAATMGAGAGPAMAILAGSSVGQLGSAAQGAYDARAQRKDSSAEQARITSASKARERSMLIKDRRAAQQPSSSVVYGGSQFGSSGEGSFGKPSLAGSSLLTQGNYTGLNLLAPGL